MIDIVKGMLKLVGVVLIFGLVFVVFVEDLLGLVFMSVEQLDSISGCQGVFLQW